MIRRSSLVHRSSFVNRCRLVNRSRLVHRSSLVTRSSLVNRSSIIVRFPRVSNISNIFTVTISNIIVNSLCSAIRQSYTVGARGRIAITTLSGLEVSTRVVIIDSILILVDSRLFIGGRGLVYRGSMVGRGRGLVYRGSLVGRGGGLVYRGSMVGRGMVCACKGKGGDQEEGLHVYCLVF